MYIYIFIVYTARTLFDINLLYSVTLISSSYFAKRKRRRAKYSHRVYFHYIYYIIL